MIHNEGVFKRNEIQPVTEIQTNIILYYNPSDGLNNGPKLLVGISG